MKTMSDPVREALEFYADEKNHKCTPWESEYGVRCWSGSKVSADRGKKARAALRQALQSEVGSSSETATAFGELPSSVTSPNGCGEIIDCYEREFYPFSNFSSFQLYWSGKTFPTSEHAYQWEKFRGTPHVSIREAIEHAESAHAAFKIAEQNADVVRDGWGDDRVAVMESILREKLRQHPYVQKKLRDSGTRPIVECSWRDDFWGWGPNRDGQNWLGKLWMKIRADTAATPTAERGREDSVLEQDTRPNVNDPSAEAVVHQEGGDSVL